MDGMIVNKNQNFERSMCIHALHLLVDLVSSWLYSNKRNI